MLTLDHLTVRYPNTRRPAVDDLTLTVGEGEIVCVVGESGSGKSTLALACLRLLGDGVVSEGTIRLDGRDIEAMSGEELRAVRGREIGFINQDALSSFNALWPVGEQISETIRAHTNASRSEAWAQTVAELGRVRLLNPERIARSYPHELSGGQRQRAALAMALVLRPKILVADEPTSALDVTTATHLLALLRQLQREMGIGVLLITHDLRVVRAVADRVVVIYAGVLGELGTREAVLDAPRYPYTRALLDALDLERPRGSLHSIAGAPPGLDRTIHGCPFSPRCPRVQEVCQRELPQPVSDGGSTYRCHFPYRPEEVAHGVHPGR